MIKITMDNHSVSSKKPTEPSKSNLLLGRVGILQHFKSLLNPSIRKYSFCNGLQQKNEKSENPCSNPPHPRLALGN
jgi:hypothetical protein